MSDSNLDLNAPAPPPAGGPAASSPPRDAGSPLSAPGAAAPLVLTPPEPAPVVTTTEVGKMMPLPEGRTEELAARARSFVAGLEGIDPASPPFARKVEDVEAMGREEIRRAASSSNWMLQRPLAALQSSQGLGGIGGPQQHVADSIVELRTTIEDLDPSRAQRGGLERFLLGLIPFRDKLRTYFMKYQSAQSHLDQIIRSLQSGQDALRKDNASIEGEKARLWDTMLQLQEYAVLTEALDREVSDRIERVRASDPKAADKLTSDLLFEIRQKRQDLLTQLAVSAQGYLALDVIRKNNGELVKGVERATTTTISALRTAVIVAQALADQKLVLDQIQALNTTTSNLIVSTSEMLHSQSEQIAEQSSSATISVESLQTAFQNIYDTIDAIDTYKVKAVDVMAKTVDTLQERLDEAHDYLERAKPEDGK